MNLSLQGKTAVICGSTQGIGLAIAIELSHLGANCFLFARNEVALKEALLHLETDERQQHGYLVADFSNPDEVNEVIKQFTQNHSVHILINNTGGPAAGTIIDADATDFVNAFQQHIVNNQHLTKAVVPGMKAVGYGRIINIISTSVRVPLNNLGVSNTIRGAVASWAKTMANELGQFGITVNNVLPGFTKTKRLESLINTNAHKFGVDKTVIENDMLLSIPAKRFGESAEIAAVAAFLASPAAAYVNGASIPVDGGRTGSI